MQQLRDLITIVSLIILLTTTLLSSKEAKLWKRMHFQVEKVHMFRVLTSRVNMRYQVVKNLKRKQEKQNEFVLRLVQIKSHRWATKKMIVYCNTIKKSKRLEKLLHCSMYHHHVAQKSKKLKEFISDVNRVIMTTSSLKLRLNVSNIRVIIHVNRSRNLLNYTQKSERAERDESLSEIVIIKQIKRPHVISEASAKNAKQVLMQRLMSEKKKDRCHRVILNEYMNEEMNRVECQSKEAKCDVCRVLDDKSENECVNSLSFDSKLNVSCEDWKDEVEDASRAESKDSNQSEEKIVNEKTKKFEE